MFKNREKKKYIYIYIYKKSASRFLRGTVLNTLKQSRINIMRGKKGRNYISHIYIYNYTSKPMQNRLNSKFIACMYI